MASAALYLRESEDIILHAERVLGSDGGSQKSGQGPKIPHVEVCKVKMLVDDDAQAWRRTNTPPVHSCHLVTAYTFADLRHLH